MNLRVKYDELQNTGKFMSQKDDELKTYLDNIQKLFDKIPEAWIGADSEVFVNNATQYINEQKEKEKKVEVLAKIITIVSGNYKDKDVEWENKVKKENKVNEYEYRN